MSVANDTIRRTQRTQYPIYTFPNHKPSLSAHYQNKVKLVNQGQSPPWTMSADKAHNRTNR
eukprot:TRINITY_DN4530_c0_g1_i1.p1 TRINITY_DN4530_c0_g1~~TRINITY_DN4530_c0_g1_i1.p1  ORF type:complete len:61 (+),score=5.47 TRINITY_DN4530_c0_g1_i1:169-351(+)